MDLLSKYAVIIKMICQTMTPGKKMLQKLLYLIERKGVELNLNYSMHFFGPYSAKLDGALHLLESFDAISIDTCGSTHTINVTGEIDDVELLGSEKELVLNVLAEFRGKSALELEAITTVDYVANNLLHQGANEEAIISRVIQIKGNKFSHEELTRDLKLLESKNYLISNTVSNAQ